MDFPKELKPDNLCGDFNDLACEPHQIIQALEAAHSFLTALSRDLDMPERTTSDMEHCLEKLNLVWALGALGELGERDGESVLLFNKSDLLKKKNITTIPSNFTAAFALITEHDCRVTFLNQNTTVETFRKCDSGFLSFDNPLTAFGLYLFVQRLLEREWYSKKGEGSRYNKRIVPLRHFISPFYRADMRVFICEKWLECDIMEILAGYNESMIKCFQKIYGFIEANYPSCLPENGFHCIVSFAVDDKHRMLGQYRMLGQLGVGDNEDSFMFYSALSGSIKERVCALVDLSNVVRTSHCGDWFLIRNEEDAERAIQIMDIQAKYNKNAGIKTGV